MNQTCWPAQVRDLGLYRQGLQHQPLARWVLNICGPFCLICQSAKPSTATTARPIAARADQIANQVSALLCLPTTYSRDGFVISIIVTVSDETMKALRNEVYNELIGGRNAA